MEECTLVLPQSDKQYLIDLFIDNFKKQNLPREKIHLLIQDISNNRYINNKQKHYINNECEGFLSKRHVIKSNKISTIMCINIAIGDLNKPKTNAIQETTKEIIENVHTDLMFTQEDDIFLNPNINNFNMLYDIIANSDSIAFASATTYFRNNHLVNNSRLAAWHEIRLSDNRTRIIPTLYFRNGYTYIDLTVTGFYVTYKDYYKTMDLKKVSNPTYGQDFAMCEHLRKNLNKEIVLVQGTDTYHGGIADNIIQFQGPDVRKQLPQ